VRSLIRWVAFAAAIAIASSATAGERASVALAYVRKDAAATRCPDEATFRGMVAARLGYDPFVDSGSQALAVELQPRGTEMVGTLSLSGGHGDARRQRTLRSDANDCFELVASMAVAAAVAVDPEAILDKGKPPPAPASPATPPPPPPPPPTPPVASSALGTDTTADRPPLGVRVDGGIIFVSGITPAPSPGARLAVSLFSGLCSIGGEGAAIVSSSQTSAFGTVSAHVFHGSLVPCVHPGLTSMLTLDLCIVGSVGVMSSHADQVTVSQPARDLFATVGPRAGVTWMPWRTVGFAASLDLPVSLSRVHLLIEDSGQSRQVWASSSLGFVGGFSLVVRPK